LGINKRIIATFAHLLVVERSYFIIGKNKFRFKLT
jgi:hypothetical protein